MNMNRRLYAVTALLAAGILALLSGCSGRQESAGSGDGYTVYYLNSAGNQLTGNPYETETEDAEALVQELLERMVNVPADLDCQSVIPARIEKIRYRIESNVLYLYMDDNYAMMDAVREILCRAALTKTLTQVPGIDYLSIYCAEQPITDAAGNPVGILAASDFVDSIRDVNSFERTEMILYFTDESGEKLVAENREVMRDTNTSLERLIVEQLIVGPKAQRAYPTLPNDVKLLNISVTDTVCSINFDAAFLNNTLEVADTIPIESIVNSLTELNTVNRVQIRINGSQDALFRDRIPLTGVFERNYGEEEGGNTD